MSTDREQALEQRRQAMKDRLADRPSKAELQAKMADKRAALEARREQAKARREGGRKAEKKRRPWWLLVLLLLLLLFFWRDCRCTEVPAGEAEPVPAEPVETEPEVPLPGGRVKRVDRPAIAPMPQQKLPWIASFRMQVAARSPRLARCFEGTERPGRLKWTTSVEPVEGHVSEHELEPVLMSADLTRTQRTCLLEVLSDPPYSLDPGEAPATPSRVGIAIEF